MSPAEIRLTAKMSVILSIVTIILSIGASWATASNQVKLNAANIVILDTSMTTLDGRVREMENCLSSDMSALRTDIRWIVYNQEQMMRIIERMETTNGGGQ